MNFSANSHWRSKGCYGSFCVRRYSYISKTLKGKSGRKRNDSSRRAGALHFAKRLLFCCRGIFQKAADMRSTFSFMKRCTVSVLAIHTVKTQRNRLRLPADLLPAVPGVGEKRKPGIGQLLLPVFQRRESLSTRIKRRRLSLICRYELLEQQHVCIEL